MSATSTTDSREAQTRRRVNRGQIRVQAVEVSHLLHFQYTAGHARRSLSHDDIDIRRAGPIDAASIGYERPMLFKEDAMNLP